MLFTSCSEEPVKQDRISGKWIVVTAARNGKETKTLEDGYFDFATDTLFRTNIFSAEEEYSYELKEDKIYQKGGENVVYSIAESQEDSLVLLTTIRNYDFVFISIRDTVNSDLQELE